MIRAELKKKKTENGVRKKIHQSKKKKQKRQNSKKFFSNQDILKMRITKSANIGSLRTRVQTSKVVWNQNPQHKQHEVSYFSVLTIIFRRKRNQTFPVGTIPSRKEKRNKMGWTDFL